MAMKDHLSAQQIATFARNLYERGFIIVSFLLMAFALLYADVFDTTSSRRALTGQNLTSPTAPRLFEARHSADARWLNTKAENVAQWFKRCGIRNAAVYHRVKSPQSAAEKARRQHKSVEQLNDLYGMRIVVQNELDVYRCLSELCNHYDIVPGTLKNYITNPKPSGYQSVHVVARIDDRRIEFQLRTQSMHWAAEQEHEAYKERMRA